MNQPRGTASDAAGREALVPPLVERARGVQCRVCCLTQGQAPPWLVPALAAGVPLPAPGFPRHVARSAE